ncbi:MAG: hypothetical protein IRY90_10510 [Actinomadura rubrobrunea]|nr:hypothetical protein [Actinomadura rubrobrunea]
MGTVRGRVAAGLGVAIVPPADGPPGTRHVPLADAGATRTIGLIWAAGRTRPPVVERFRRFVLDGPGSN